METKKKVNVTIDAKTAAAVRKLAAQQNRKFSNMVDTILKEYVEKANLGAE